MILAKAEQEDYLRQSLQAAFFQLFVAALNISFLALCQPGVKDCRTLGKQNSRCIPFVPAMRDFTKRVTSVDHFWHSPHVGSW